MSALLVLDEVAIRATICYFWYFCSLLILLLIIFGTFVSYHLWFFCYLSLLVHYTFVTFVNARARRGCKTESEPPFVTFAASVTCYLCNLLLLLHFTFVTFDFQCSCSTWLQNRIRATICYFCPLTCANWHLRWKINGALFQKLLEKISRETNQKCFQWENQQRNKPKLKCFLPTNLFGRLKIGWKHLNESEAYTKM